MLKECIICKRILAATIENFAEEKKGKLGLGNTCRICHNEKQTCGVSNQQAKVRKKSAKYLNGRIKP